MPKGQWAKSTPITQDTPSQHAPARIPHAHPTCTHCLMLLVRAGHVAATWGGGGGGGVSWHGVDADVPTHHTHTQLWTRLCRAHQAHHALGAL